jgi:transposase, IS30 family
MAGQGRPRVLGPEQRRRARELWRQGWSQQRIGAELGCSHVTVGRELGPRWPARSLRVDWEPGGNRLSLAEREEISLGLARGESFTAIGAALGRAVSTVSREVAAGGGRVRYRAAGAHRRAFGRARRPKKTRLSDPRLAGVVTQWLLEFWSPLAIARRLRLEFPDDPMMWVSHETIYQSLFVQGRGELRKELTRCLRSGRTSRRRRGGPQGRGVIPGMVMISERPPEVADRAVPGHWEGDLVIGQGGKSAVGTLVERTSRYMLVLHLPHGHDAPAVDAAMRKAITKLPGQFFRTITWDQGREMARHGTFSVDTGIQIYFCDPHSPWQRPTNENTNGLLRQYMPKGTDLSVLTETDLDAIARSLNDRPRKRLNFMKPSERLAELLAMTG